MLSILIDAIRDWVQTVLANFYSMYLGYVTPQMYGAVGDGVHDDTEAFKKVFAHKGLVRIPKGTYLVTAGMIAKNVTMSSQLHIVGEGYEDSIIKLVYPDSTKRHGFILYGNNTDLTLENFAIIDEKHGEDPVFIDPTLGEHANVLLMPKGVFKDLILDGIKVHTGGDSNFLGQYTVNVVYLKCSADTLIIRNCVFENFTNRQWGSCVWYEAYDDVDHLSKHIEDVIIHNNIFRHTCSDEALALYSSTNDPDPTNAGYTNVTIQNNQMLHKNFNGECHTTSFTISVNNTKVATAETNVLVQGNKFVIDKCGGAPMKSTGGRVIFECNQVIILSAVYNETVEPQRDPDTKEIIAGTGHLASGFALMRTNQATVRNNHFIGRAPFTVTENVQSADVVFEGNVYDVYGGNVRLLIDQADTDDESTPHKWIFKNNTFNADTDKSVVLYVYNENKHRVNQNQTIIFEENRLTCNFTQTLNGRALTIRNNVFNYLNPNTPINVNWSNYVASDVRWINNQNCVLKFYNVNTVASAKRFTFFEYWGIKSGLSINTKQEDDPKTGDTPLNRSRIAVASKIIYTDEINEKADKTSSLPTASYLYEGKTYLYTGNTTSTYQKGGIYECQQTSSNTYEWKLVNVPVAVVKDIVANSADYAAFQSNIALL